MRTFTKIGLALTLLAGSALAVPVYSYAAKNDTFELLNLFGDVFERVRSDYVEEVKDSDLIEAALNGMLTSLDPHSGYMNEKAFKEMQVQTKGEFGGLGIEVTMDNGLVKVVSPIDDTPAFKAGVQAGDYITQINDEAVMGMSLNDAVEKMRGPIGTTVKITIIREGQTDPLDINVARAVIKIQPVKFHAEGNIGYIRINSFSEPTFTAMQAGIAKMKKDLGDHFEGLVLDLRNNPGGLLDQAVDVSDAFLDKGEIVSTRERDPKNTKRYSAHAGDITGGVPIVVLINTGSASASEIVAGALQDQKRAIILGTKSFGKGSVQTVIPLPQHGAMRLTTARYYTPSGHSIQAKGITPDIMVEQAKIEPIKPEREMMLEANLRNRLANPEDAKKPTDEKKLEGDKAKAVTGQNDKDAKKTTKVIDPKKPVRPGDTPAAEDFQLSRALDLLHALNVYKQNQEANAKPVQEAAPTPAPLKQKKK